MLFFCICKIIRLYSVKNKAFLLHTIYDVQSSIDSSQCIRTYSYVSMHTYVLLRTSYVYNAIAIANNFCALCIFKWYWISMAAIVMHNLKVTIVFSIIEKPISRIHSTQNENDLLKFICVSHLIMKTAMQSHVQSKSLKPSTGTTQPFSFC